MREKLFERFATDRLDGVGLGLASADHFCRKYGGHIAYRPAEVSGSVFTLLLPLADGSVLIQPDRNTVSPPTSLSAPPDHGQSNSDASQLRVLIVDDEPDALEAMAELLANFGCRVATARSLGDAWAAWGDTLFDIIFIDASLQYGEQSAFIAWVRDRNPHVSIGAISGALSRLTATPDYDFALPKPLSKQMLGFVLEEYLARS
jgi:CheY-like chemotaxis protein